jgi:glycosyltransferase involved in cell wall biosynthesis
MNVVQITPGAGKMYCGNCFRDNALVAELRRRGHATLMVPLYLPLTLDETDQSQGTPVFFGGVNVYLDQQSGWFRRWAPSWLRQKLSSPAVLRWASGRAAKTRAADVGELTLSMLRGEEGHQARDLAELAAWLAAQPPADVVCLSNAMLLGMARELKRQLRAPVVCMLQGEDAFLDGLPPDARDEAWRILASRASDVDLFVTPSRFFGSLMARRLGLSPERIRVVPNGISLEGYAPPARQVGGGSPAARGGSPGFPRQIGYFARMCRDKGLDLLVDAFLALRKRGRVPGVRLRLGGGCGPADEPLVSDLEQRIARAGLAEDVDWVKNPDRQAKLQFLSSLTVFSVPARCGEAFGLYVIEALAAGVPVVLPRLGAFVELVEHTGGGVLCVPDSAGSLAGVLEELLLDESRRAALATAGHASAHRDYGVSSMAGHLLEVFEEVREAFGGRPANSGSVKPVVRAGNVR